MKYTLSDAGYQELRRRTLRDSFRIYTPLFFAVLLYGLAINGWDINASRPSLINGSIMGLIGFTIAIFTNLYGAKVFWEGYEVFVDSDSISQKSSRSTLVVIHREDIKQVSETPQGTLRIRSHKHRKSIYIPNTIDQYQEIKQTIGQWHSIQKQMSHVLYAFTWIIGISVVLIGSQYILLTSQNIAIVTLTGVIILGFVLGSCIVLLWRKSLRWYMALLMLAIFCYNGLLLIGRLYGLLKT